MKYLLVIQKPTLDVFALIAWDEVKDAVVQRLGWFQIDTSIYVRLVAQNPTDPLTKRWSLCEFKDRKSYIKGRNLYSRHSDLSKYQALLQPGIYQPLTQEQIQQIQAEYTELKETDRVSRSRFIYSVDDLAADWGIDKKQLYRYVTKGLRSLVTPSKRPNQIKHLQRRGSPAQYNATRSPNHKHNKGGNDGQ